MLALAACSSSSSGLPPPPPGVIFTYPADAQVDVPTGSTILVTFSDPVTASAVACHMSGNTPSGGFCLVGPEGMVTATPTVSTDGMTVSYTGLTMDEGAQYTAFVGADLAPTAQNLPSGPVIHFTTRSLRQKAAPPTLVAINGGDPMNPESFRPMLESSTVELVFSEPLDARTVALEPGAFELLDPSNAEVPATIVTDGIHVAIDPTHDLTPGSAYTLKVGAKVLDTSGQAMAETTATLTPRDTHYQGSGAYPLILRTRQAGDPGSPTPRFGVTPNQMAIDATIIGSNNAQFLPAVLVSEAGDPRALGGPISFTLRKGQKITTSGIDLKMGGQIATNVSTGTVYLEILADSGGRMYRNPHQDPSISPDNARSPLYVDFTLDVAVYSVDPKGNATLAQTNLGVQAVGVATATDGVLDIETFGSLDLGVLGVSSAPINLDLEVISDLTASGSADTTPPNLVSTEPGSGEQSEPIDRGIELIFDEGIDLDSARNGGLLLKSGTTVIPAVIESHGSALVIRPLQYLQRNTSYSVVFANVMDMSGNPLPATAPLEFKTEDIVSTSNPMTVSAIHPGYACALTGATSASPGRCSGGAATDDLLHPYTLAQDQPVEVTFTQPPAAASVILGTACNQGSVRIEQIDNTGACTAAVPGTLLTHDRSLTFVPDVPWTVGGTYRLVLVSGSNTSCTAGDLCGITGAASFDPLAGMDGTGAAGGPNLVAPFTVVASVGAVHLLKEASPYTDLNGNGQIDTGETRQNDNAAALQIKDTGGIISGASFNDTDCVTGKTDGTGDCQFLSGIVPIEIDPVMQNCTLPDGTPVAACVPVVIDAEPMFGTSMSMTATVVIGLTTTTETTVLRVREPADGPVVGAVYDNAGMPTFMVELNVYMDAPDMSVTLSSHDLHSKPLSLLLAGPLTFTDTGRLQINLANQADVPLTINISNSLLGDGHVDLVIPAGGMKLQLRSKPLRGSPP